MDKWIEEELAKIRLGDERLNERAKKILSELSQRPSESINGSFKSWQETKAVYSKFH